MAPPPPPPPPPPRLCLRLAPHGDSVLSVAFSTGNSSPLLLASGGEDGALLLHDLRCCCSAEASSSSSSTSSTTTTTSAAVAARSLFADPVAALAWQSEHVLYLGSGERVHRLDTRKLGGGGGGGGGGGSGSEKRSSASSSSSVVVALCEDEVSSLSVSRDGKCLAVADDSGVVSLLDLSRAGRIGGSGGEEEETAGVSSSLAALSVADRGAAAAADAASRRVLLPSRRLPRAHAGSLATAVAFQPGRAGESLVSGGCDCSLARWDCRSGRLVRRWQASEITRNGDDKEEGTIEGGVAGTTTAAATATAAAAAAPQQASKLFNPPFVHALAVPSTTMAAAATKPWSGCVAAALGDGSVAVLDCDARGGGGGEEGGRHRDQRSNKKKASSSPASSSSSLLSPLPPFHGVLAVLRPEDGGHLAAATCVAFVGGGEDGGGKEGGGGEGEGCSSPASQLLPQLVASGGDDGRLLFWEWARSAAAAGSCGQQQQQKQQLPAAWARALAPFRGGNGEGERGGSFVAAATARGKWKIQALSATAAAGVPFPPLVAAADTSRVVKVYQLE